MTHDWILPIGITCIVHKCLKHSKFLTGVDVCERRKLSHCHSNCCDKHTENHQKILNIWGYVLYHNSAQIVSVGSSSTAAIYTLHYITYYTYTHIRQHQHQHLFIIIIDATQNNNERTKKIGTTNRIRFKSINDKRPTCTSLQLLENLYSFCGKHA